MVIVEVGQPNPLLSATRKQCECQDTYYPPIVASFVIIFVRVRALFRVIYTSFLTVVASQIDSSHSIIDFMVKFCGELTSL